MSLLHVIVSSEGTLVLSTEVRRSYNLLFAETVSSLGMPGSRTSTGDELWVVLSSCLPAVHTEHRIRNSVPSSSCLTSK